MKVQEAISLLDKATARLQADRETHEKIKEALNVLRVLLVRAEMELPELMNSKK